jgi:hypothetical protein
MATRTDYLFRITASLAAMTGILEGFLHLLGDLR